MVAAPQVFTPLAAEDFIRQEVWAAASVPQPPVVDSGRQADSNLLASDLQESEQADLDQAASGLQVFDPRDFGLQAFAHQAQ